MAQKPQYFQVIADFSMYPKSGTDITLDFFDFLERSYPGVWEKLNEFYADDASDDVISARIALYGWDRLTKADNFPMFLSSLQRLWPQLSGRDWGVCPMCKEEKDLDREHTVIVSYEYGPMFKVYEHFEMDGSVAEEVYHCRSCAQKQLVNLVSKMDGEKESCWV